nr:sensor domain-containing diguanylate cyclase [uncultured Catonella sp.]
MDKKLKSPKQVFLICLVVIVAFTASAFMFAVSSFKNTGAYIEQTTDMTAMNVINDINSNIEASVRAAKAIAGNSFIVEWSKKEADHANDTEYIKQLYDYLKTSHEGNNYNFVFYASKKTENIYYQDGVSLKMLKQNADDKWLYDFMNSNLQYRFTLNPFKSKTDTDKLSMLIIYKMTDTNGNTLGAIGMSINLSIMERIIMEPRNNYNVSLAFTDLDGNVIISREYSLPEGSNIFEKGGLFEGISNDFLPIEGSVTIKWLSKGLFDVNKRFCEMRYIKAFNRYLIVYGSGDTIMRLNRNQLFLQLGMLAVLLLLMLAVIINTISQYRNSIISLATLDELTKIMNRKSFMARFDYFSKQKLLEGGHLFLIDIDFFKTINDTLGHTAGDEALSFLATKLTDYIGKDGFIARWGGDEFIGVLFSTIEDPISKIRALSSEIAETKTGKRLHLTLSVGIAPLEYGLPLNKEVEKADIALYTSKKNGRNQTTMYDESQTGAGPEYSKELIENSKK